MLAVTSTKVNKKFQYQAVSGVVHFNEKNGRSNLVKLWRTNTESVSLSACSQSDIKQQDTDGKLQGSEQSFTLIFKWSTE